MKHKVQFINLEEDDKDLIVSFAVDDPEMVVKSLILLRTLFFEEVLDEKERGVNVSLEGDYFEQEDFDMLNNIKISDDEIWIKSTFREYQLDISNIQKSEIEDMVKLLKKQNYDNRFTIDIA
ncbi:MAG: hypothetical protein U9Q38_00770 [Thermodesulfobacteriota bacterium]|nr:hypothetical protein [Thermodesulfobacteriota bacterium]